MISPNENARLPLAQPPTTYISNPVTFGLHLHRKEGEDCSVYYMDDARGIRRQVVNEQGQFCDFPVVITQDFWLKELKRSSALKNQIRFRTSFEKTEKGILVLWCVQPDGRYWEDEDGFGATNDLEIVLYSFLDDQGKICAPFRIYSLGTQTFYSLPHQEKPLPPEPPARETATTKEPLLKRIKRDPKIFKEILWILTALGNAAIFFIIGFMATEYDTYYGKTNPYSTVLEYMLDDILWVFLLILLVFNLITIGLILFLPSWLRKKEIPLPAKKDAPPVPAEHPTQEPQQTVDIPAVLQENNPNTVEQLERLKTLLDNGTVTKKEFKALKEKILKNQ